jgi:predicted kinase
MRPHVVGILRQDLSVVLDFPANTVKWRSWMRSLINEANVAHELHFLDVPDVICKDRLRQRNISGEHPPTMERDELVRHDYPPNRRPSGKFTANNFERRR